jgi:hypothetical protein
MEKEMRVNNMLKGILIKTDNTYKVVEYEDTLETLQNYVGGLIEYVNISRFIPHQKDIDIDMIVNDEGKIINLEYNELASIFYPYDYIAGDVLVVATKDGENISLTDNQIEMILNKIKGE